MTGPIIRNYDKKTHKKCIKCRAWKPRQNVLDPDTGETLLQKAFGDHNSSDGLQSICHTCKNNANVESRTRNVRARIRHHVATRCLTQLGDLAPKNFTKDLESYLGYKIPRLVEHLREDLQSREGPKRKLRDVLEEGYHIDHIAPLSSFKVICLDRQKGDEIEGLGYVDWAVFKECWVVTNLSAIPAAENLAKGAKIAGVSAKQLIVDDPKGPDAQDEKS